MTINHTSCHGTFECLGAGSTRYRLAPVMRVHQEVSSYLSWWLENVGWRGAFKHMLSAGFRRISNRPSGGHLGTAKAVAAETAETLALQAGDLVEVKSIDEILSTLDHNRRNKGLLWMSGMRKYCGKRYRVYRPVKRIILESNGELRRLKNTVLLEGVMCDGKAFGGCDRSCFHFWREAWLRRVP